MVKLVSEPLAVPVPLIVAEFPLKLAEVISELAKSTLAAWSR